MLGIVFGWYRWIRLLSNPFVNAFYSMPRVAMVPLIIMWFGIGMKSKVFIVFLFSFFPILVNTIAGVKALDPDLLRAARAYCATDWQIFKTVALPGSVPFILTGIRQGVSLGLIGVVIGEMLGGGSRRHRLSWSPTADRRSRPTLCLSASSSLHLQEYSSPGSPNGWSVDFSRWKPEHQ